MSNIVTESKSGTPTLDVKAFLTMAKGLEGVVTELKAKLDEQSEQIKAFGTTNPDTVVKLKSIEANYDQLLSDMTGLKEGVEETKAFRARFHEAEAKGQGIGGGNKFKSLGELTTDSPAYQTMVGGNSYESGLIEIPKGATKALTLGSGSAGDIPVPYRVPEIISTAVRPMRIRDLLTVTHTESTSIDYIRETGFTDVATGLLKQGGARTVLEGATKPETNLTFVKLSAQTRTIAYWLAATRQTIKDVPQLQAYIDNRLLYGLYFAEESQILYGNGTDPNLQGIMTVPGTQTYSWSAGAVGDTIVDAVRRAMTKVQLSYYPTTGIVMHPSDWEKVELAKGDDGHYLWLTTLNPLYQSGDFLWKVPVVSTDAMVQGQFLAGAFKLAAFLWDREDANIRISEHHANFFIQNMVAILAEERIALTIFRPEAFVIGTLDNAPTP